MAVYRGIPYRPPQTIQADTSLGFDPSQQVPFSPEELDQRQPVLDANQRLQDALQGQASAAQPSGLSGVLSNPIFQTAVPAALTALSAIFPRHMAIAGPVGLGGFRSIEDANMLQNRMHQAQASDVVKQRQDDFNRQRLRYAVDHADGIDPTLKNSIMLQANTDVGAAAKAFDAAAVNDVKNAQYGQDVQNFDAHRMVPGQKTSFRSPYGAETTFQQPEHTPYGDFSSGDPALQAQAQNWEKQNRPPNPYADFASGDPKRMATASAYQDLEKSKLRAEKQKVIDSYLDGVQAGTQPVPLPSARGGMTEDMQMMYSRAAERGIDMQHLQQVALANKQLVTTLNGQHWQGELKNVNNVEQQLNILQRRYNDWKPYATGMRVINSLALQGAAQVPGPAGVAASNLLSALQDARRSLGVMLNSGAAITDDAAKAGHDMIREDMPVEQFEGALDVSRQQATARKWALLNPEPILPGAQDAEFPNQKETRQPEPFPQQESNVVAGKYKTQKEAEDAYVKGEITKSMFQLLAKRNGWNRAARR